LVESGRGEEYCRCGFGFSVTDKGSNVAAFAVMDMTSFVPIRMMSGGEKSAADKERALLSRLAEVPSLIVALSGGADSAYLAWAAWRALGVKALSVTAVSPTYSSYDRDMVEEFVRASGVAHEFVDTHEMENPAYRANASDRCFFCKD
jgi:uncharacterized protein